MVDYLKNEYVTEDGSEINTRVNGDGTEEEQCPSCNNWYQNIGVHWGQSNCGYPSISQKKYEMCIGLMMGDGCISENEGNCSLKIFNTNKKFIEYLESEFGWLGSMMYISETASESADNLSSKGVDGEKRDTDPEDCNDVYALNTRSHPALNKLREWYQEDGLVFQEVEYTPTILRMWYVSDGGFNKRHMNVEFSSVNESLRSDVIVTAFDDLGINVSNGNDSCMFRVSLTDQEKFFNHIGYDPIPGFEYKWADDKEEYEQLKEKCEQEYMTQTIE